MPPIAASSSDVLFMSTGGLPVPGARVTGTGVKSAVNVTAPGGYRPRSGTVKGQNYTSVSTSDETVKLPAATYASAVMACTIPADAALTVIAEPPRVRDRENVAPDADTT